VANNVIVGVIVIVAVIVCVSVSVNATVIVIHPVTGLTQPPCARR